MLKKAGILSTLVAAIALPVAAHALQQPVTKTTVQVASLAIVNNTNLPSVIMLHYANGTQQLCSNDPHLGGKGITQPGTTNNIPVGLLAAFCQTSDCTADVYINGNADCSGPTVGTATYNVNNGVTTGSNGRVTVANPNEIILN